MDIVTAIILNFISAIIGGSIGYFSASKLSEKTAKQVASAKLRAVFSPALSLIYIARKHGDHNRPNVNLGIKEALLKHGAAVEEFMPFIEKKDKNSYISAWEKYRDKAAMCPFDLIETEWSWRGEDGEILEKNIRAILSFANPT